MQSLSRRTFLTAAASASLALAVGNRTQAFAQPVSGDRSFESALTSSVIELVGPDWEFNVDSYALVEERDFVSEYLSATDTRATVEIEFVQTQMSPEEYLEVIQNLYRDSYTEFELVDSDSGNDGAWFAATASIESFTLAVFCEYQAGAYENADLVVITNSVPDNFVESLDAAQSEILIGDLEPMIMIESSGVKTLDFSSASTASGRQSRGSSTASASADSEYIEALRARRTAFMDSFENFAVAFGILGDDASTDAEREGAMFDIDDISADWATYAGQAAELPAPSEYADLEVLYIEWAEGVSELGYLWMDVRNNTSTLDDFFAQVDVVNEIDIEFNTALASY